MHAITSTARTAAIAAGAIGLVAATLAIGGEVTQGTDFMGSPLAAVAGWLSFASPALLVVALVGVAVRWSGHLGRGGATALLVLAFATAATVGAAATLALIVPALVDIAPEMAVSPPAAVPATFILSGLVMAASSICLAFALRPHLTKGQFRLLVAGSVVAMLPLPSRSFLLAFALAPVLRGATVPEARVGSVRQEPDAERTHEHSNA